METYSMPAIVDIYARVSTEEQEENTSLDEQEAIGRQYCRENNLIVGMVHREVFSGYQYRERKKLELIRQRYRDGKIKGVVIRTLDRLSRSQIHNAILMEEMEHHEVILYCVKENIDDTPMGKFVRMVLAFVAEMEREKITDRSITGRMNKAKQGIIVTGRKPPYGYERIEDEKGNRQVVVNEQQAETIRWIYDQYIQGVSALSITKLLTERGVPAPEGGTLWNDVSVGRILSDQRVTGTGARQFGYQHNKGVKIHLDPIALPDGTYPMIVSQELFDQVAGLQGVNKSFSARNNKQPEAYLLRAGFVKCGHCGKPMMAVQNRDRLNYRCPYTYLGHTNVIISKKLDDEVWQWLIQLADHIEIIEKAVELATCSNTIQKDTEAIEHSIANWQAKANNYLNDLDDTSLIGDTRTAVRQALNNANKIIAQLEEERTLFIAGMVDKKREREAYKDILTWCKKVKSSREELTYQQKRDFLRMLGVQVIVENVKPYYTNMIYRIEITLPAIQELMKRSVEDKEPQSGTPSAGAPMPVSGTATKSVTYPMPSFKTFDVIITR